MQLFTTTFPSSVTQSPAWLHSPFARYAVSATRPFFTCGPPTAQQLAGDSLTCFQGDLREKLWGTYVPDATSAGDDPPAQLLVEWLPEARETFLQWSDAERAYEEYRQRVQNKRRPGYRCELCRISEAR